MNALYYTLAADGSQAGPFSHAQMVAAFQKGEVRRESLVRRADLAEFFAMNSYPEFTQVVAARVQAVPRGAVAGRPKAMAPAKTNLTGGTKAFVWAMVLFFGALLAWGGVWAWGEWRESSAGKQRAEAEKWKSENLPEFRVVNLRKRVEKLFRDGGAEIAVDGEVEEKGAMRHPVFGRAERSELYVRLAFATEFQGEINLVQFEPQWVRVREGKGSFTLNKTVEPGAMLRLLPMWEKIKVEGRIKYEK